MNISFLGACGEVTGSCTLVEASGIKFLVDCGMFQGLNSYEKNLENFSFNPKEIDFVFLTHAHLDHSGRLPILYKEGFRGKVFSTKPTKDLAEIILKDSARIFEKDFKTPLFDFNDISNIMNSFETFDYYKKNQAGNIFFRALDAGHILGSSIFEFFIEGKKIVFSGDLGNDNAPIVRDTDLIDSADVVVVESTYGGKVHADRKEGVAELAKNIEEVIQKKSVLLIPSFSIERTQELLFEINNLIESKKVPFINVFLDSPLAIKATSIYRKYEDFFDKESITLINSGDDIFDFDGFKEAKDTKKVLDSSSPKIIMAGSGMCSGGRIPFYIKIYGKNKDNIILLNSYQAEGTMGRRIEAHEDIFINNKKVQIKAKVEKILSFSSHADSIKLKNWVSKANPSQVFINHGEKEESLALKRELNIKKVTLPVLAEKYLI
ncbi:MAG: MBL fold metallo-hydrolase [Candidatus Pacebacteria bacterium]|nr:MBL fold metallo-hydrolase [Candidatus Paceibacterota bacterium]MDD3919015.1 MBL fold metallo-hydrolase [Candidatus Paceibacterota bacterium]